MKNFRMKIKYLLMNRILTSLFLSLSFAANLQAQSTMLTLDECVQYALENSINSRNAQIDKEIAAARVKETVGIGLPQVSGSVVAQQSPELPRFFAQYNEGAQGAVSFISPEQAQEIGLQDGDVWAAENFFQLQGSGNASLTVNQLIFNGSYFVGLQAANAYKDLATKEANQTNETVVINVMKAFYNVLINEEQLVLINSNIRRLDTLIDNTQTMYENGFAEKLDVDRLKVNRNNLETNRSNLENFSDISMRLLKFHMNYPFDQELSIQGNIRDEAVQPIEPSESVNWSYGDRPDYQVLEANYSLQQLNIKNKYAEAIPVISAFANLGYTTQSPDFGGIFRTNANFSEVGGVGPDTWYNFSTVGLSLSWNLFTGLQRNYQIQQEKLSLLKIENGFKSLERSIDLEVEQSQKSFENALERLDVQEENMQLAEEILDVTRIKFEEGVGSNLEVIEADNDLTSAQTNYYQALYDAILAKIDLLKAQGRLYKS